MHYYENLLTQQATWRPNLDGLTFESLDPHSTRWLVRPFNEDEIQPVISGMTKEASGFDGFSTAFFSKLSGML